MVPGGGIEPPAPWNLAFPWLRERAGVKLRWASCPAPSAEGELPGEPVSRNLSDCCVYQNLGDHFRIADDTPGTPRRG